MTAPSIDVLNWLTTLVSYDTTSRGSTAPLVGAITDQLREHGLKPRIFPNGDGTKANLLVSIPNHNGSVAGGIMLAGHLDCVPIDGQNWTSDPFTLTIRDGKAYGRGTTDMKGFDACVLASVPKMLERPLLQPIHVVFTYDEEVGCQGAGPMVEALKLVGVQPSLAYVGEPTSMKMVYGHKSHHVLQIDVRGVTAHSSLTPQGTNAIEYAAQIVRYWREKADQWRTQGPFDEGYLVPYATASVNQISGGIAQNIIPSDCRVIVEFRSIGATKDAAEIRALRKFCAKVEKRMKAEHAEASITVTVLANARGLDTAPNALAIDLGERIGLEPAEHKVNYCTEAGVYSKVGKIESVVCGPGDIAQAHTADEFIELSQLAACEEAIGRLIDVLRVEGGTGETPDYLHWLD